MAALFWLFFGWARETAAVSAHVLCTPYNQAPVYSVIRSHIANVHMYLQITCHLHFRQNDRELLGATAITRGWSGYRNRSQHRNWPWRNKFSRRSCRGSNPRPFDQELGTLPPRRSTAWSCSRRYRLDEFSPRIRMLTATLTPKKEIPIFCAKPRLILMHHNSKFACNSFSSASAEDIGLLLFLNIWILIVTFLLKIKRQPFARKWHSSSRWCINQHCAPSLTATTTKQRLRRSTENDRWDDWGDSIVSPLPLQMNLVTKCFRIVPKK